MSAEEQLKVEVRNLKDLVYVYREHVEAVEAERDKLAAELEMERNFRRQLQRKMLNKSEDKVRYEYEK